MIRRPPRSRLSPYTTLFRSAGLREVVSDRLDPVRAARLPRGDRFAPRRRAPLARRRERLPLRSGGRARRPARRWARRSEEHTSELQSRQYLVSRLLLEKNNSTSPSSIIGPSPPTRPDPTRHASPPVSQFPQICSHARSSRWRCSLSIGLTLYLLSPCTM